MSGHSKWSTIKRQKGTKDQKRGQVFTKLSNAITIAVRQGGGVTDPDSNFRLRLAVEDARSANMPKENIKRAIDRASNKQEGDFEEVVYEGFGPGGFSVIIEAFTDKKQRTTPEVKNIFDKNGGSLGVAGSVIYQFEKKGMITVSKIPLNSNTAMSLDDIFLIAAECNASDIEEAGDEVIIYTKAEDLAKTRNELQKQGLIVKEASLFWKPVIITNITEQAQAGRALKFVELLEDLDDVHKVYVNFDIPDNLMEGLLNE